MTRLFWLGCATYAVVWVWALQRFPDRVPLHFGPDGEVDRWGGRTEALVIFAVLGVGIALVLALSSLPLRRGSWRWVNVPHKAWWTATPERQRRLRRMATDDLAAVGALTMVLLSVILVGTVHAARQPDPELPWWLGLAIGSYLVAVLAGAVWAVVRRYRPDEDGAA